MGPNRKDLDYLCIFNIFMIDSSKNKQKLVCSLVEPEPHNEVNLSIF